MPLKMQQFINLTPQLLIKKNLILKFQIIALIK